MNAMAQSSINRDPVQQSSNPNQGRSIELSMHEVDDIELNGGYGWVCVAACWIFNAFTWGGVSVGPTTT